MGKAAGINHSPNFSEKNVTVGHTVDMMTHLESRKETQGPLMQSHTPIKHTAAASLRETKSEQGAVRVFAPSSLYESASWSYRSFGGTRAVTNALAVGGQRSMQREGGRRAGRGAASAADRANGNALCKVCVRVCDHVSETLCLLPYDHRFARIHT